MREEPDFFLLSVRSVCNERVGCTYGFVSAEFDEGVKKRTNPSKSAGHSGLLRISGDKNFDMTFKGLDDREYHFFEVWIQEIRLLLEAVYLRGRKGSDIFQG